MSKKKTNGEVFTPQRIIDFMLSSSYDPINMSYVLEPGCGDGRFIISIIKVLIKTFDGNYDVINSKIEKIYGIELDLENYLKSTRNVEEFISNYPLITTKPNIIHGDALLDISEEIKWDYIIGNPPYVRIHNLSSDYLKILQENYEYLKKGMVDLYYGFFELHKNLSTNGVLCFITPNSFLYNKSGEVMFKDLYDKKLFKTILDFDSIKVFENASTYTCITTLCGDSKEIDYTVIDYDFNLKNTIKIQYDENDVSFTSLKQTKSKNKTKFSNKYKVKTGFATLSDKTFVITNFTEYDDNITFIKNGTEYTIEKSITKKCIKASRFDGNYHRVIFPYHFVNDKNIPLTEGELRNDFPLSYEYLLDNKEILLLRDKGKTPEDKWYLWGRTQGINNTNGNKVVISPMYLDTPFNFVEEEVLIYSGYYIISETFDGIFRDDKFIEDLKNISKPMAHGWKSIQKKSIDEVLI